MLSTMQRRGQAALEFLTTYGWAFMVILVVIGALAYFGVLNPSKYLPEKCDFGNDINCERNRALLTASDTGTIKLGLISNFPSAVKVTRVSSNTTNTLVGPGGDGTGECAADSTEKQWNPGKQLDLTLDCEGGVSLPKGEKEAFNVYLTYYDVKAGSNFEKTITGELFLTLQ